jgi:hypothetical protein
MLLIFVFSITPKQYLHDLVVRHKDDYSIIEGKGLQVAKIGFQCDCNQQVVQLPYLSEPDFRLPFISLQHFSVFLLYIQHYSSAEQRFSSLRGPPVTA